ncbi:MAG TPA: RNA methyltransferase [Rubricoccaceae bacterium]|jgi:TrmH family RNA methyltransferase
MTRQRLHDLAALHRRRGRDAHGVFLVEGVRSVEAAVAAGAPLVEILVADDVVGQPRVADLAARAGVRVSVVPAADVERVSDAQTSQGVVAVSRRVVQHEASVLVGVRSTLVLDGVQDPGNVGALVRSAAWFGVEAVVTDGRSADPEGPKAVRASMGGLWDVALVRVAEIGGALDTLADAGAALWGADLDGTDAASWEPAGRLALVLGSEAHGLSPEVADRLEGRVAIARGRTRGGWAEVAPADDRGRGVESLNVVVAAGVLMHRWLG